MDRVLSNNALDEIITSGITKTPEYQKCSYITPDGQFLKIFEHYEVIKWLVQGRMVISCNPDAEQLLSDLGYIRYSWVGYVTLADKKPNKEQYKALELALINIAKTLDVISIQIHSQPKLYLNYNLNDIPNIIKKIKLYYSTGKLLP